LPIQRIEAAVELAVAGAGLTRVGATNAPPTSEMNSRRFIHKTAAHYVEYDRSLSGHRTEQA